MPTLGDRIVQTVVAARLGARVGKIFHTDSDGYRVGRSAIDAGAVGYDATVPAATTTGSNG